MDQAIRQVSGHWKAEFARHLVQTDGSAYSRILPHVDSSPAWGQVIPSSELTQAEVIHAVREEAAEKSVDVVLGRTGVGTLLCLGYEPLRICALLMADSLERNESRTADERCTVMDAYIIQTTPEA
jgi:glycerol-3-phosphate dehydrogenase